MFTRKIFVLGVLALGIFLAGRVSAHTPLCSCYDNGDGTVTCEGGFSDGSSASGVEMRVMDKEGNILFKGRMDDYSGFSFDKPFVPYSIEFDAGPGHVITIGGEDIH